MVGQREPVGGEAGHRRRTRLAVDRLPEAAVVVGDGVETVGARPRERPRRPARVAARTAADQQRRPAAGALVVERGVGELERRH
jgi:hypothetical protein